ncbi:MAG: GAF domain-containing protein, partial [candidate division Zixibacteria bacterium]|nr:GAF domain-containing protein [candidate division KSB1 bacterium]NIR67021.1 GAF domain-containing protein [candidate division Zixibacteria bacterium]NIS48442.1 GAF domain-containing protein [candidate division Zixibacteria bacterium]NIU16559.1 GAF domain-containing protein [candidate division Zixibacteria bacterium]NIV08680.1 GAF domain-containing protein [candidate division Zixibacteria bacterium]
MKTISDHILEEIVEMTSSPYGFYGFMNDSEDKMDIYSWSEQAMSDCEVHSSPLQFPIDKSGIWGNAVRDKEPFLLNDYSLDCENKMGVPEGHVALKRVLSVPVMVSGKVVAVAAVANKTADYTNADISQLESFLNSVQLIIERKKMEDALKEREEHYRVLFHRAPHGSAVADAETGIIIECNEELAKLVGRSVEELLGQSQTILHPHNPETGGKTKNFEKHQGDMEGQILEDQLVDKNGNVLDVEIKANRMTLNGRDVMLGFFYDVTERKKMFEEYRRSAQLAALGTVAAGVAHEINNPIQGIMNYATIIEKTPGESERTLDIARRISSESERIAEITRELLDFAKDNRNKNEHCDFRDVIESAIDLIEKKTIRRGISIETTYDDNLPKTMIYRQGIQQIIINLIDNSCDALEYQDIPLNEKVIKVACYLLEKDEGQNICMEIADQGMGMSEETLQRATETFYSTKPSTKGTGLGLSIVNDIVNKH